MILIHPGVLLGLALRFYKLDAFYIDMIAYPGELFMRLLKLMILPLVIASLIAGSASLNAKVSQLCKKIYKGESKADSYQTKQ